MHHATVFNYFEFGTDASHKLDMSQFHKISIAKLQNAKILQNAVTGNPQKKC